MTNIDKCKEKPEENGGFCEEDIYGDCYYCGKSMIEEESSHTPPQEKKNCGHTEETHLEYGCGNPNNQREYNKG